MEKETSKRKKNSPSNARLTGAPLAHKIAKLKFQRCIHILLSSFRASSCTNGNDNGIIEIIGRGAGSRMVNTVNTVTRAERGARGGRKENRTKFRKTLSYPQKPCRLAFCSPVTVSVTPLSLGGEDRSKFRTLLPTLAGISSFHLSFSKFPSLKGRGFFLILSLFEKLSFCFFWI